MTAPPININVALRKDRTKLGMLTIGALTFQCLAISDNQAAIVAGNPTHDPLKVDGDLPTGEYKCLVINPGIPTHSYGPGKRLMLVGVAGDALKSTKLRSGLMVHGGDLNPAYTWWQGLRPTHGCLRLKDADMALLIEAVSGADEIGMRVVEA